MNPSELLTPKQLQKALSISKPVYLELLRDGLPHIVITRGEFRATRRFQLERVVAWFERRGGKHIYQSSRRT